VYCAVRFEAADAVALAAPDGAFDVVRAERVLQWIPEPERAVSELARVVRPGGLVSLIDTDWSTFDLQVGDEGLGQMVRDALRIERHRPSNVGRRLASLAEAVGLHPQAQTTATQTWTEWDPDRDPAPVGCFSMASLADDLVERDHLRAADREAFVATVHDAARQGRFSMALTMFALIASASRRTGRVNPSP
jgi:ubiquinone/menaquinone biosynthesis C-methylase UbiE